MDSALPVILLAEDDPNDALLLEAGLQQAHLSARVITCPGGAHAIEWLNQAGVSLPIPSLFLLDWLMPMVDGHQVLCWLNQQARLAHIPVIVFSGSQYHTHEREALRLGAREFIPKPSHHHEMVGLLQSLYARYLALPQAILRVPHAEEVRYPAP